VILLAMVLVTRRTEPTPPESSAGTPNFPIVPAPTLPSKIRTVFILSKATIKTPAAAALAFREGTAAANSFLNDLAKALEPYRNDDYPEAARRLLLQSQKYPSAPEVYYYLGVSRLFLDQNSDALQSLERARRVAGETLRDDVAWYLSLALDRSGRTDDAGHELNALCARAGDYQQKACAALKELR